MTIQRMQLEAELTRLLQPQLFRDYCPNGLQVQGTRYGRYRERSSD
jgi:putative NIF3 family GTP cyclohydrolase 1 type 2